MKGLILTLLLVGTTAMASDKVVIDSHCISIENGYSTTTVQCDDGTVTVAGGGYILVCRKDNPCEKIDR